MKICLVNKYLYPKGGDAVFTLQTGNLLREKGHEVVFWGMDHPLNPEYSEKELFVPNVDYNISTNLLHKAKKGLDVIYSFDAKRRFDKLINKIKPDIIHFNNFAHQISPSVLHVVKKYKIPAVMTMPDYKMVCPIYTMVLNGKSCNLCKKGRFYNCALHKCTKGSIAKSTVNTIEMYLHHRLMDIYKNIKVFISTSKFQMNAIIEMGFNKKIEFLPNFINLQEFDASPMERDPNTILYFGRISVEKGLNTLIDAVKLTKYRLKISGEGPLRDNLINKISSEKIANVSLLGYLPKSDLKKEIQSASVVVLPSECNENNPMSILESFGLSTPVIGAKIGGIPELIIDTETGYTFEPGNAKDLTKKIELALSNPATMKKMGQKARKYLEEKYNSNSHYKELMRIYEIAKKES